MQNKTCFAMIGKWMTDCVLSIAYFILILRCMEIVSLKRLCSIERVSNWMYINSFLERELTSIDQFCIVDLIFRGKRWWLWCCVALLKTSIYLFFTERPQITSLSVKTSSHENVPKQQIKVCMAEAIIQLHRNRTRSLK